MNLQFILITYAIFGNLVSHFETIYCAAGDGELGYPIFTPLLTLLKDWNPDLVNIPQDYNESLHRLNFSNDNDRKEAKRLRDLEVPFKLYDIPKLNIASNKWNDMFLSQKITGKVQIERSLSNHFLF